MNKHEHSIRYRTDMNQNTCDSENHQQNEQTLVNIRATHLTYFQCTEKKRIYDR